MGIAISILQKVELKHREVEELSLRIMVLITELEYKVHDYGSSQRRPCTAAVMGEQNGTQAWMENLPSKQAVHG